jgi:ComF family protein
MRLLKVLGIGLSPEDRAERERLRAEEMARREMARQLAEEAAYVADLIQRRLVELNICYHYKKVDKKGFFHPETRSVAFRQVTATPEAHYLQIETRSMPRGVTISQLYDPVIIEALGYSIGTEVGHKATKEIGFWYIVPRKGRLGGIPRLVKYADALAAMPDSAPVLAYPIGFGENKRFIWDDLEAVTNLLIAGSKGGGKSNALNMILCTLIQRAGPDDLRLFLVDLKAGMEFIYYANVPHLGGDQPYTDPKTGQEAPPPGGKIIIHGGSTIKMLEYVLDEIKRRGNVLRGKAKKLSVWNKRFRKSKIPYWVVVIDELGDLMLDTKYRAEANNLLSRISQLGRAVGVHLILATQTPNKDTVPRLLKNNLDARLAFRCADGPSSMIVVDDYDASYLPRIPGRMLYVGGHHSGFDRIQVQTPHITDDIVNSVVRRVKRGETGLTETLPHHDVTHDELWRWAMENGGDFSERDVFNAFTKRGLTRQEIRAIGKEFVILEDGAHDPKIEINDEFYHLMPAAGTVPRRLVRCALCAENSRDGGEADELAGAVESFSEVAEVFETPEKSEKLDGTPGDTPDEWDSDGVDWDSDSDTEIASDANDTSDSGANGREPSTERSSFVWQPAEPVKGVKGELTNRTDALDWVSAAALWDGTLRDSVKDWKYHRNTLHLDEYKRILVAHFRSAWPFPDRLPDALVAVPLHGQRLASRGFNQAEVLARALADETGIPLLDALMRIRHTQPQVMQRDEYRGSNVEGAFISMNEQLPPVILVIDDLITSGATMSECARVLKGKGARWVGGMALARPPLKASKKIQAQAKHMPPLPVPPLPVDGNSNENQTSTSPNDLMDWVDSIIERNQK